MKKLLLITIASFFGAILQTHAQTVEECATGIIHERLMENDSEYANTIAKNNALIKLITETQTRGTNAPILEIPVVVHIVHTGQSEGSGANISMTQINSAIDRMNNRYRNVHGPSVDTEIEFVLAQRDPNGNATTGVVRVDGSGVPNYSADLKYSQKF